MNFSKIAPVWGVLFLLFIFGCNSTRQKSFKLESLAKELAVKFDGQKLDHFLSYASDSDAFVRTQVAGNIYESLAPSNPSAFAPKCIPVLNAFLSDSSGFVRRAAAQAIGGFGKLGGPSVPGLIKLIETSPDTAAACFAVESLGEIGEPAKLSIPTLIKSLDSDYHLIRSDSAAALGKLGLGSNSILKILKEHHQKTDDTIFQSALEESIRNIEESLTNNIPAHGTSDSLSK